MKDQLTITADKVRKAAKACPAAKDTLKTLFPEVFEPQPFEFGNEFVLSPSTFADEGKGHPQTDSVPLFIGQGIAPNELFGKCLMVNIKNWRMKTEKQGYHLILSFYPKEL